MSSSYHYKKTDKDGDTCYYNVNGQLHRTDGPAIEYANGDKCWYLNDRCFPSPPANYNNIHQLGDFVYNNKQLSTIISIHPAGYATQVVELATQKVYWAFGWVVEKFVSKRGK